MYSVNVYMLYVYILDLEHLKILLEEGTNKSFSLCATYDELRDTIKVWANIQVQ